MQDRRPVAGAPSVSLDEHRLWSLAVLLAPGDEDALRRAAEAIAGWGGVRDVTIEVLPERVGREPLRVTAGRRGSGHEALRLEFDVRDRGQTVGSLRVVMDTPGALDPGLPALCEAATVPLGTAAARCRLESLLLDAQSYEVAGQIAAGLVHDFNNMLTGIAGNATIAHALLPPGDRVLVPIERIEDAVRSASSVSRALLGFVRGTLGRSVVSVNELAATTEQVLSRALPEGVTVSLDLGPDVPPVEGEQVLLQQALVNLVMNAVQSVGEQGRVTIRTRRVGGVPARVHGAARLAAQYAALAVIDTGPGIPAAQIEQVFQPFFTTRGSAGTGLGLPSVVQVARRHGGAVGVESAPGAGATFTIYLPGEPAAPPSHRKGAAVSAPAQT